MKIERIKLTDLRPDEQNARKHDQANLKAIAGSLDQFGQRKPIVITQDNRVVAGNGTLTAAKLLDWKEINCVRVPADWTADQIKAYALADNRTAELAEWDEQVMASQLLELQEAGFDIEEFGFELVNAPTEDESEAGDEIPEVIEPRTKLGQIWQLGRHRLACGDAFDVSMIDKLLDGNKVEMVYTDPPYGMNLDTDYSKMGSNKSYGQVIGDDKQFNAKSLLDYFATCDEVFLWGADYYVETLHRNYPNLGSWIIWDKYSDERIGVLDGKFGSAFETCWSKQQHKRELARVLVTTNYTARGDETRIHPTQKPVALAEWFFDRYGKNLTNIVDLFGGSGSTLIAAEKTNRTCFMMELDPKYCDVIIQRWENLTGQKAELVNASR